MGRPPRLQTSEILDRALPVFWKQGFEGTSLSDLEQATGLGRQCLYNHFADKQALYLASLHHYGERSQAMLAPLRQPDANLETIRRFFATARAKQREAGCGSCMMVKVAFEHPEDPGIQAVVRGTFAALIAIFATIIARGKDEGSITDPRSNQDLAAFILAIGQGAVVLEMTDEGEAACERAVRLALALLSSDVQVPS